MASPRQQWVGVLLLEDPGLAPQHPKHSQGSIRKHAQQGLAVVIHLYRNRLPLKNKLLLDTVRTWLDFSSLQGTESRVSAPRCRPAAGHTGTVRAQGQSPGWLCFYTCTQSWGLMALRGWGVQRDTHRCLRTGAPSPIPDGTHGSAPHGQAGGSGAAQSKEPLGAAPPLLLLSVRSPRMLIPPSAPTPGQPLPRPQAGAVRHRHKPAVHSAGRVMPP